MNNTGKIITAFAVGAATGAALGILFAPGKGSETRKKMNEQGKKMAEGLKEKMKTGKEKFESLKEDIEQAIKEKTEDFA